MSTNPKWRRGLDSSLDKTSHVEGNILLTTDTGRLFVDIDGKRIEVTDFSKMTESEILATLTPLPKFYFATDTGYLYYYNDGWKTINSSNSALAHKIIALENPTTKAYIMGIIGPNGETPIYDSNVYLDTESGSLHVSKINGYTLAAACAKAVKDNSTVNALSSNGTGLVTERAVYYGTPTINGSHAYTSNTNIYAPTVVGTENQILLSSGSGAPVWANQTSLSVGSATKATQDGNGNVISSTYAKLASPTFTGTPKAPTATAGTNTTQIATTAFVTTAVANAITGVTSFEFIKVDSLPETGAKGIIYLVPNNHGDNNAYDEYIWFGDSFEKIGNTDINLTDYVTLSGSQALTNKTYNGYTLASACAKTAGSAVGNVPLIGTALGTTDNVPVVTNTSGQLKPHSSGALGAAAFKAIKDNTTGTAIGTGTGLVTERAVYYGTPFINGTHAYTSSTNIYAPVNVGTKDQVLVSSGTGAPVWVNQSDMLVGKATADADGNNIGSTYAKLASPTFTGTPKAPTAVAGNNSTQIATTAFVTTAVANAINSIDLSNYVTLASAQDLTNKTYNGYILAAACAKAVKDNEEATAISESGTDLVTERTVYYGLPKINNSHAYTSNTSIYAPTSGGTSGYFLKAGGTTTAPTWVSAQNTCRYLGMGYGTCSTAAATVAKTAAITNYTLVTGSIVAVKFTYDVPAGATLNINSKGAKSIYHLGSAIKDGVIRAGAIALFLYSTQYHLIALDSDAGDDYGDEDA